ncbi:NUDIX domain-containing protein [Halogeometricum borinquense]|uniref:NUDIX domain-containing protein n=1 Tax=Halogeometricum borinquense TaxID=60847 RepID=A0A6C0UKD0_9EURY|nr:NUDIX domain-containing protein [Halogeometricum borinquense]QIB75894.1 NUDIX domain-containing protein [Halogeometricum borinquense]QIQ75523.1 NUDIX domain-containing protein [Halogeometricum borinquense]
MAHVVTCFVRNRGAVLLTLRSEETGTYSGRWAGISGYIEGDPDDAETDAWRELREETGLGADDLELVRAGETVDVEDGEGSFVVHPFLFESDTRTVTTNEELAEIAWTDPTAIRNRPTVPRLWETWRRVAPTVEIVRTDRTHGSAWISARALEALRDAAIEADDWAAVAKIGRELRDARPSMAAVCNRVNRVLSTSERTPESVATVAIRELDAAFESDEKAARTLVRRLRDAEVSGVATLSRSGTVSAALRKLGPTSLLVAESRPEREGVTVAETVAEETDAAVTVTTEAALPAALARREGAVDAVVVGADAVHPDGSVVNKTGTSVLASAAQSAGVPVYVVAASDKVRPTGTAPKDAADEMCAESPHEAVYDGDADVDVFAPTFERVSADLVDGLATEKGLLDAAAVRRVAAEHAEHAAWTD